MTKIVLILGASGRFGRHAAEAFWNAGWQVRLFDRATDDLAKAASGAEVIVNAWNPPYTDWVRDVPKMTEQVIKAAKSSGATVLIPGNIYGYGAGSPELLTSGTPMQAQNPLGRIRNKMEAAYRKANVPTIILRAGDYIDTEASGNWFDQIITAKLQRGKIVSPGNPDIPHAWAYLPDLARAAVALAERRNTLSACHEVLFSGFTLSLRQMASVLSDVSGQPLRVSNMHWAPLWIAQPFWPMASKLIEMRYLWNMPHSLDPTDMQALLPRFRDTDPSTALAQAIRHLDIYPNQPVPRGKLDLAAH